MGILSHNWQLAKTSVLGSVGSIRARIPRSVNVTPSNRVTDTDSGFGSVGVSYAPSRKRQRQPFKWGQ